MSRNFKNVLRLKETPYGKERRRNIAKETVKDSTPLPQPLEYKDIDKEFRRWVDEDLDMTYDGNKLPTVTLFSNQRFSEYMQTWQNVDDKKNLILNFKTITRDNNPRPGSMIGQTRNIPGNYTMLLRTVEAYDKNNRKYFIDYRMKQPFTVDLVYTVSIIANKYELLNEFNQMINEKFKAIDCYIRPNGYFIPMKLNDISDESQYSIDNRQFYLQSYSITVMAYIIEKDSFIVEERPDVHLVGFEGDRKSYAEIEEPCTNETDYDYDPTKITIHFDKCETSYKFKIDVNLKVDNYFVTNIRQFRFFVNDTETVLDENLQLKIGDIISIKGIKRFNYFKDSEIVIEAHLTDKVHLKEEEYHLTEIHPEDITE